MQWIIRVLLPLALFAYIAIETYLKLRHTSLCGASGCKLAGELLRFNPIYLHFGGMVGAALLVTVGFLSLRKRWARVLFFPLAYGAVAFEATIFFYQAMANPQLCLFCAVAFTTLLIIAVAADMRRALIPLAVVAAIGAGVGSLAVVQNSPMLTQSGSYLIYSPTCAHCRKVKAHLAKTHTPYTPIPIADPSARRAMKVLGIETIPVWIEAADHRRAIYVGDRKILAHLAKPAAVSPQTTSAPTVPDMGGLLEGGEEGCTITIDPTEAACDDNATP